MMVQFTTQHAFPFPNPFRRSQSVSNWRLHQSEMVCFHSIQYNMRVLIGPLHALLHNDGHLWVSAIGFAGTVYCFHIALYVYSSSQGQPEGFQVQDNKTLVSMVLVHQYTTPCHKGFNGMAQDMKTTVFKMNCFSYTLAPFKKKGFCCPSLYTGCIYSRLSYSQPQTRQQN